MKVSNKNLHTAKKEKNDEFYTQLSDIEKELGNYKEFFKDKIVFCNCDDPEESNFWNYFALNFEFLGYRDVHREHQGKNTHWVALDFKVKIDPLKTGNGEPHKFDAVEWFSLDAFPEPLHSQLPNFLNLYKSKI